MVRPVHSMKTSSSEGRATLTDPIPTASSANRRGTKFSPSATWKVTWPSWTLASMPKRSRRAAIAAGSSAVEMVTRSRPTPALSWRGLPLTTIRPPSMIAIRPQFSASSM